MGEQRINTVQRHTGVDLHPDRSGFRRLLDGIRLAWASLWGVSADGNKLYQVRATSTGCLHTQDCAGLDVSGQRALPSVPLIGVTPPDERMEKTVSMPPWVDWGSAADRLVLIYGRYEGTEDYAFYYDADTDMGTDRILGISSLSAPLITFTSGQYLTVVAPTYDGTCIIHAWNL